MFGASEAEACANAEGQAKGCLIGCEVAEGGRDEGDDSSSLKMRGGGEV